MSLGRGLVVAPLVSLLLAIGLHGCSPAPPESWDGSTSLVSARSSVDPQPSGPSAPPPARPMDPGCEQVLAMVDTFRARLEQEAPPPGVFETMQACLEDSGRLLDLVDLAALVHRARPGDPLAAVRLANAFLMIGDADEALRLARGVLARSPSYADALFVEGLALGHRPRPRTSQLVAAVAAWSKLLEVSPDYEGLGGYSARMIRRELAQWRRALDGAGHGQGEARE